MKTLQALSYGVSLARSRLGGFHRPLHASIYVTHRCNLRCVYCSSPYIETEELSLAEWQSAIAGLSDLGCRRVAILGGEPLVRGDIAEIISSVKANGMHCVLTSNGLLVPRCIGGLEQLDTLVLSLDGIGEANDSSRGKGVFEGVRRAIDAARRAGIPVKLNAVMTRASAPRLDHLLQFVEDNDLSVTVNVVRSGNELWHNAEAVRQDQEQTRDLLLKLARVARTNRRLLFSEQAYRFAADWPDYGHDRLDASQCKDLSLSRMPRCHAGLTYLSIGPDGTAYPCALTANRINGGNVVSDGVERAWRSLHGHDCVTCFTPCMLEQNYLHSMSPGVIARFALKHLRRYA